VKLLTFSTASHPTPRIGVLANETDIVDVGAAALGSGLELAFDANDMISLIESGKTGLAQVRRLLEDQRRGTPEPQEIHIHAPIPRPRKNVFCVGWNYLEHFQEGERIRQSGQDLPTHPVFFTKATTAVNSPTGDINCDPALSEKFDWEVELGVIIGVAGKSIREENAMGHVFGYTVVNDISVRDVQRGHGGQWFKGKSFDGTCPMGPYLVTVDELDPEDLRVQCRVNGETKQDSNTSYMYFKIPRLIAELSRGMTLEPGDIISTGTPEGVGFARNPPEFLKPGDVVETEISGIGVLRNWMVD
jgi:2-keto-4-pentenoate hydratase/2-oxohepta-3-ene-1,7-dioic acid hydratase in catechol pathway